MVNVNWQSLSPQDREGRLEMWDAGIRVPPELQLCVSLAVRRAIVEEAREIPASEWYPRVTARSIPSSSFWDLDVSRVILVWLYCLSLNAFNIYCMQTTRFGACWCTTSLQLLESYVLYKSVYGSDVTCKKLCHAEFMCFRKFCKQSFEKLVLEITRTRWIGNLTTLRLIFLNTSIQWLLEYWTDMCMQNK